MASDLFPKDPRLLSWEAFRVTFLEPALGADIPVPGAPSIHLFLEPAGVRIGLRVRTDAEAIPETNLRSVTINRVGDDLVVASTDRELFQPFYALLLDLADRIQLRGESVGQAVTGALNVWRRLLSGLAGLTDDEQLGLSGELWVLARLVRSSGPGGVMAWLGPGGDTHDFRTVAGEIEVKTTRGAERRHVISRLEQLQPSPGHRLFIVSLQFAAAGTGDGWTLGEQVAELRKLISNAPSATDRFSELLTAVGWHDEDSHLYVRRWRMRSDPRMIEVDTACPRLTPAMVDTALGDLAIRVDDVRYRVNLEGLGAPDGSEAFLSVCPAPQFVDETDAPV